MKLGKETGSVINYLSSNNPTPPVVGKGATELCWTDRHAWFVQEVSNDGKRVIIEGTDAIRTDDNGMSESQSYRYKPNGNIRELRFLWGAWRYKYQHNGMPKPKYHKMNIVFGYMNEYYDFSF